MIQSYHGAKDISVKFWKLENWDILTKYIVSLHGSY